MNSTSYLFEEPNNLLKQKVREPARYNAIISAVATGSTKLSEISSKVGEKSSKKTLYVIADNLFRSKQVFHHSNVHLYLFSKTGFTKGCVDKSNELGNVKLVTFDEVVSRPHGDTLEL